MNAIIIIIIFTDINAFSRAYNIIYIYIVMVVVCVRVKEKNILLKTYLVILI